MMKFRMMVVALSTAVLTSCASTAPTGVARWVDVLPSSPSAAPTNVAAMIDRLPSTAAGGTSTGQSGAERQQLASDSSDPCSGSRRMARIRCQW